jgi:cell division protein FtsW
VQTWESRIENFSTDKPDEDDYQIEKAKSLLLFRKFMDLVQESVQNFYSRHPILFMYIIVEEYGLIGWFYVLILLLLLFRFVVVSQYDIRTIGVVIGLGFPMIFQAMINMAVAVELLPVTGQTYR